jgi:hypothetical protein
MFRKLILTIILLTITFSGVVYTQTTITIYSNSVQAVVRYKDINNNHAFQYSSLYQIGRKDGSNGYNSGSQEDIYRSQHSFGLTNIPSTATITQVKLVYFVSGSVSNYFTVTQTSGTKSWGNLWSEIESTSVLESNIPYVSSSRVSNSLINAINSARTNGVIYLGTYSQSEGTNNTQATVVLRLEVTYLSQVNITAQNNFIYGTIKVGVNQAATQRTSPYPLAVTEGNTINLEAEEQTYDGYYRLWNDTEAPIGPSKWIKKTSSGSQTQVSSSISHSLIAAVNDNNSTYEAGLRKLCNLTFQNYLVGLSSFGTINVNGQTYSSPTSQFQVVEQNAIDVSINTYYFLTCDK